MKPLTNNDEQRAQSMACAHLVRGCEDAVSSLVLTGAAAEPSAISERAHDILAEVLSSWRDASEFLRPEGPPDAVSTVATNLDGWTSDELFAEALGRRADDVPALRLMQGTLLQAFLTAYDSAPSSTHAEPVLN